MPKAVTNNSMLFKIWQKSKTNQDKGMYCKAKQACKKIIAIAKRTKSQKLADKVNSEFLMQTKEMGFVLQSKWQRLVKT